ncbi:MAG TPA: GNAT family N-acetyltransferase [Alphaproteobacteria bacterium]
MNTILKPLSADDFDELYTSFEKADWKKPDGQFERYLNECHAGERYVWVVHVDGKIAGYGCLLPKSTFKKFHEKSVPEISDLNILPDYRGKGLATLLMDMAETKAKEFGNDIGLGVGLHPGYGAAQILYVKRGYIPLGDGLYYGPKQVEENEQVTADNDLVMYLQKKLK